MKWTMDEFMSGKLEVRCANRSEFKKFMKILSEMNVWWHNGSKADKFTPPMVDNGVYIRYNNYRDNRLTFGWCKDKNERTEPWSDFVGQYNRITAKYKVEIECDGTTTTAKLIVDGKEVKSTTAKKHPEDKFNLKLGLETAFGRLFEKKEDKPDPKRDFEVGDRVVYVSDWYQLQGMHGRIVAIMFGNKKYYGVDFDNSIMGKTPFPHSCDGKARENHGKWCVIDDLIHEPKTT